MTDEVEQDVELTDDSLAYEQSQSAMQANDPLAAIKALRLGQLAVCRLKSEQEMQRMRDELKKGCVDDNASKS